MELTGKEPDDVTRAALETVSEAVEQAGTDERRSLEPRRRGLAGLRARFARRAARRADRAARARRLRATIGGAARRGAQITSRGVSSGGKWLSGQVLAMAPRLPVRDLATLRSQYPDRSP